MLNKNGNEVLKKTNNCKQVGITFSKHLKRNENFVSVADKVRRALQFTNSVSKKSLEEIAYWALRRPILEYERCWDSYMAEYSQTLDGSQN